MSSEKPAPPRIAIKFGAASSSRPNSASSLGKRPRPQLLHAESDSEQDDEWTSARHEPIATISAAPGGAGGNGRSHRTGTPLSITPKRTTHGQNHQRSPQAERTAGGQAGAIEVTNDALGCEPKGQQTLKWGLTLRNDHASVPQKDQSYADATLEGSGASGHHANSERQPPTKGTTFTTADDEALGALLGSEDTPTKGGHTIINIPSEHTTEGDVFRRQFREAPDVSTLKEYEDMPVEEFGGALLRGMGWDGKLRGPKSKEPQRRPNQIGLGAKALNGREDLGSWNQKANGKSRPRLNEYNKQRRGKRDDIHQDKR
ncbi:hypothetical protein RB595_001280 [Gaeumannomyces hyphopodioides]